MKRFLNPKFLGLYAISIACLGILISFIVYPAAADKVDFALSDFGVISNTAIIFNITLIIAGILNFFYALYLNKTLKLEKFSVELIILVLVSIFLMLIGFFPYSIDQRIHWFVAFSYFILSPIVFLIIAVRFYKRKYFILLGIVSMLQLLVLTLSYSFFQAFATGELIHISFSIVIYFILFLAVRNFIREA